MICHDQMARTAAINILTFKGQAIFDSLLCGMYRYSLRDGPWVLDSGIGKVSAQIDS